MYVYVERKQLVLPVKYLWMEYKKLERVVTSGKNRMVARCLVWEGDLLFIICLPYHMSLHILLIQITKFKKKFSGRTSKPKRKKRKKEKRNSKHF
jgi:hypothetical protein